MDGAAPLLHDAAPTLDAPGKAAPLVDPSVLGDMARDFSDPAVVLRCVRDFSATLEGTLERFELGIEAGDATGAEDAVLSVTTSAMMAGAVRLDQAARAVQRMITAHDLDGARRAIALLRACAADTLGELRAGYPDHTGPAAALS